LELELEGYGPLFWWLLFSKSVVQWKGMGGVMTPAQYMHLSNVLIQY